MTRSQLSSLTRAALAAVGALTMASPAVVAHELTELVPADAMMAVHVTDVSAARAQWEASPLAQLWSEPEIKELVGTFMELGDLDELNRDLEEFIGYDLAELLALVDGGAIAMLGDFDVMAVEEAAESAVPQVTIVVEVGENAEEIKDLIVRAQEREDREAEEASRAVQRRRRHEYRGVTVHVAEPPATESTQGGDVAEPDPEAAGDQTVWALTDGLFVFGNRVTHVEEVIAELRGTPLPEPVTHTAAWKEIQRYATDAPVIAYVNIGSFARSMEAALLEEGLGELPVPVDTESLLQALNLRALEAGFASLETSDDGTIALDLGVVARGGDGLMGVLAYGPGEPSRPDFVPPDAVTFSATRFDFEAAWQELAGILDAANPALRAMLGGQVQAAAETAGVELPLNEGLVEAIGTELVSLELEAELTDPEQEVALVRNTVMGLAVDDAQTIDRFLESLKALAGAGNELFSTREYLGHTVHEMRAELAGGMPVAYTLTGGWLLVSVGPGEALEKVLVTMGRPASSAWRRPDVQRALSRLPAGAVFVEYEDTTATLVMAMRSLAAVAAMADAETGEGSETSPPAAVPDASLFSRHVGPAVSGMYRTGNGLLMRLRLLPPVAP